MRRKRTGVADYHRGHWLRRPQGSVTESLRVALSSFRKLYDLLCDCISVGAASPSACWRATRAISKATPQKTCGLGIKPVPLEVSSDRHGYYVQFNEKNLTEKMQL